MTTTAGDAVRTVLRGIGQTLITLGLVVLLFCVYEVYFTNVYTNKEQSRLGGDLREQWAKPAPAKADATLVGVSLGSGFAEMWIPRVGMVGSKAKVVVEGVSHEDLKRGPGHYPGTALPGQVGNVVVSGHRTTYGAPFNRLDELRVGDAVVLETRDTWFTYRVTKQQVVAPTAVEVTYPVPGNRTAQPTKKLLTLTTCNPKYSARTRLIISAELETSLAKTAGDPPALTGQS
ncbi:MAG: class E sortase [Actinobacteria bacterium]|nr:class E sortase [Actinomycetota bacterium]MCA1722000.1 class E sortase [Actinomycetota bacterium]